MVRIGIQKVQFFLYSRDKDYIIEYDDEDETIGKLIEIDQSATSDEWEREGF